MSDPTLTTAPVFQRTSALRLFFGTLKLFSENTTIASPPTCVTRDSSYLHSGVVSAFAIRHVTEMPTKITQQTAEYSIKLTGFHIVEGIKLPMLGTR